MDESHKTGLACGRLGLDKYVEHALIGNDSHVDKVAGSLDIVMIAATGLEMGIEQTWGLEGHRAFAVVDNEVGRMALDHTHMMVLEHAVYAVVLHTL